MIDLTLTFPTRQRPENLHEFCYNMASTVVDPERLEIIVQYDWDDEETGETMAELRGKYPRMGLRVFVRDQGANLSEHYYNWLVQTRVWNGKYMMVGGDDFRVLTRGWDRIIPERIEEYLKGKPDRVAYAFPVDRSTNKPKIGFEWGWFPILTREAVDTLGWFFPKEAATWGADVVLAELFQQVGRVLPIPEVMVDHKSYHAYNLPKDEVAVSMAKRFDETKQGLTTYRRHVMPLDVKTLRDAIGNDRVVAG